MAKSFFVQEGLSEKLKENDRAFYAKQDERKRAAFEKIQNNARKFAEAEQFRDTAMAGYRARHPEKVIEKQQTQTVQPTENRVRFRSRFAPVAQAIWTNSPAHREDTAHMQKMEEYKKDPTVTKYGIDPVNFSAKDLDHWKRQHSGAMIYLGGDRMRTQQENNELVKLKEIAAYNENRKKAFEIKAKNNQYTDERADRRRAYESVMSSPDFAEYAQKARQRAEPKAFDPIKKIGNKVEYAMQNGKSDLETYQAATMSSDVPVQYTYLTDKERDVYNYYYTKYGEKEADKYLKFLERDLNMRNAADNYKRMTDVSNEHKAMGTAVNLLSSFGGAGAYGATIGQNVKNMVTGQYEPVDANSNWFAPVRDQQATQEGITRNMSGAGKFLANTGLSIGQNLVQTAALGPLGASAPLTVMSLNAAGNTAYDATKRGATAGQALALSTASGAIEAATEKLPLDNIFKTAKHAPVEAKQIAGVIGKQMFTEGSEELISEYANNLADWLVMGGESEYNRYVKELIQNGASEEDAKRQARLQYFVYNPLQSFAGGALSGGVMGAGATAVGSVNTARAGRQINHNGEGLSVLLSGLDMPKGSEARAQAEKMAQRAFIKGKDPSNLSVGALYGELAEERRPVFRGRFAQKKTAQDAQSNSVHTPEQLQVMREYEAAVDEGLVRYASEIKKNPSKWYYRVAPVNEKAIGDIKHLTGIDVSDSYHTIDKNALEHIETGHGANGTHDHSMADFNDVARIAYVLNHYDDIQLSDKKDYKFKGKNNEPSPRIVFSKRIDGSYYVVEAVPNNANNRLSVVTAYKNKAVEEPDTLYKSPKQTSNDELPHNAFNNSITSFGEKVKGNKAFYKSALNDAQQAAFNRFNKDGQYSAPTMKAATAEQRKAQATAGLFGHEVIFFDDESGSINGAVDGRNVFISRNAENPVMQVLGHELTHSVLADDAMKAEFIQLLKQETTAREDFQQRFAEKQRLYQERIGDVADDTYIWEEFAADIGGELFMDDSFIERVTQEKPTLAQRIVRWFRDIIARMQGKRFTADGENLRYVRDIDKVIRKYEKAFERGVKAETDGLRYEIKQNSRGKYVQADRQVITGDNADEWEGQIYDYINDHIRNGQDVVIPTDDGDHLTISEKTAWKMGYRNGVRDAYGNPTKMSDSDYKIKANAATYIDELSKISRRGKHNVPDMKNHDFAQNGFNYRTAYFRDLDGQYYRLTISVGENAEQKTVYNIGKIERVPFPALSGSKASDKVTSAKRNSSK